MQLNEGRIRRSDKNEVPTLQFNYFDGEVLFSHTEDFKITEDGLFGLGVSIDLNT